MLMPLSGWQEGHMNRKAVPLIPNGSLSKHVEEENCCSCHPLAASKRGIKIVSIIFLTEYFRSVLCIQCFDAVGWAAGRASGL